MRQPKQNDEKTSTGKSYVNPGDYPVIVALQGPLEGKKWEVENEMLIGRDEECAIALIDRQVSRVHARVSVAENGRIFLEDLGSKNGTFHKGKPLEGEVFLDDGDVFQVAMIQKFAFYVSDATVPLEDVIQHQPVAPGRRIQLNAKSRRVWVNGEELVPSLSAPQFRLLDVLWQQSGKVVSRNDLIAQVWQGEEKEGISEQALDALIRRLRSRLAEVDADTEFLVTVRGHGLRLEE